MRIEIYLDDGRVFGYELPSAEKIREHAHAIIQTGYRHNDGLVFEHYPPHRILKVKYYGQIETKYRDDVSGT